MRIALRMPALPRLLPASGTALQVTCRRAIQLAQRLWSPQRARFRQTAEQTGANGSVQRKVRVEPEEPPQVVPQSSLLSRTGLQRQRSERCALRGSPPRPRRRWIRPLQGPKCWHLPRLDLGSANALDLCTRPLRPSETARFRQATGVETKRSIEQLKTNNSLKLNKQASKVKRRKPGWGKLVVRR